MSEFGHPTGSSTSTRRQPETADQALWPHFGTRHPPATRQATRYLTTARSSVGSRVAQPRGDALDVARVAAAFATAVKMGPPLCRRLQGCVRIDRPSGEPVPARFFLSYAHADEDGYVARFFDDLVQEVQRQSGASG